MGRSEARRVLIEDFTEPVRDPVWGNIHVSPAFERLAFSPPFAKLARIRQLGPAYLVYPGATHSRQAHSLGVFHMARRILLALLARGESGLIDPEGALSLLAAALCHDLGHFPFAHSLKELPLEEHEVLTARKMREAPLRGLIAATGADPELAAAIVDLPPPVGAEASPARDAAAGDPRLAFYRGLLSGVLDPDKLDYLNRDAYACGVPYGIQDCDFILERLELLPEGRLGLARGGIMSVEGVLFAKYLMYRSVYWHRDVRAATALVKKTVLRSLRAGRIRSEELYGLDDAGFLNLLAEREGREAETVLAVLGGARLEPLLDLAYDPGLHGPLLDLELREQVEEAVEGTLGLRGILIDVPESVSFESDLPVRGEEGLFLPFSESSTVFGPEVVAGFARSLRRLRIFAPGGGRSSADPAAALAEALAAFARR